MDISLRKAHILQTELISLISSINISSSVAINEFQEANAVMSEAQKKIQFQISRKMTLLDALESIRHSVAYANFQCGISMHLTTVATCQKQIMFLEGILRDAQVADPSEMVEKKLARLREMVDSYRSDTISVPCLTAEVIDEIKHILVTVKARKIKAQDALVELNSSNYISIDKTTHAMLKAENLMWD